MVVELAVNSIVSTDESADFGNVPAIRLGTACFIPKFIAGKLARQGPVAGWLFPGPCAGDFKFRRGERDMLGYERHLMVVIVIALVALVFAIVAVVFGIPIPFLGAA